MQNKFHNRTLFVAAISVYLGLLIVGAPPQVLAQTQSSQTNSQKSRDGDKFGCPVSEMFGKPIEVGNPFEVDLAEKLIAFLNATKVRIEFVTLENPTFSDETFHTKHLFFKPYIDKDNSLIEHGMDDESVDWMSAAQAGQIVELDDFITNPLSDCPHNEKLNKEVVRSSIEILLDNSGFKCEFLIKKATPQRAEQLASDLRQAFVSQKLRVTNPFAKSVYENTIVSFENNQVFIVTRLPRAGLDALLKAGEKAN
jgi:hypothetical protein